MSMSILIILTPESMLPQAMDVRSRSMVHIIHATFGRIEKKYWPQRKAMEIMKEHDDDRGSEDENGDEDDDDPHHDVHHDIHHNPHHDHFCDPDVCDPDDRDDCGDCDDCHGSICGSTCGQKVEMHNKLQPRDSQNSQKNYRMEEHSNEKT